MVPILPAKTLVFVLIGTMGLISSAVVASTEAGSKAEGAVFDGRYANATYAFNVVKNGAEVEQFVVTAKEWRTLCEQQEPRRACEARLKSQMLLHGLRELQRLIPACAQNPLNVQSKLFSISFYSSKPSHKVLVVRSPSDEFLSEIIRRNC